MRISLRLNKYYDLDLISLLDDGYPLAAMMRKSVVAYANGEPLFYYIDNYGISSFHTKWTSICVHLPDDDPNVQKLLKNVRPRHTTGLIKIIFRNSLIQQNVPCFFPDAHLFHMQEINAASKRPMTLENVIYGNSIRQKDRTITFAGHSVNVDEVRGRKASVIKAKPGSAKKAIPKKGQPAVSNAEAEEKKIIASEGHLDEQKQDIHSVEKQDIRPVEDKKDKKQESQNTPPPWAIKKEPQNNISSSDAVGGDGEEISTSELLQMFDNL